MAKVTARIGNPTRDIVGQPVPIILPDPASLFLRRADRLDVLAADHAMANFLRFLAHIVRAQHAAAAALPALTPPDIAEGAPPLAAHDHRRDPCWQRALATLLHSIDDPLLPEAARDAARRLAVHNPDALADAYLNAEVPQSATGEALFIAAALQVYFAHRASALPIASLHLLQQRGLCPVCGSPPMAGMITATGHTPGLRYLHCGLCATAWNFVRATCVACGGSRGVGLMQIEGGNGAVQAETCDDCHSYAKMLYQANDMSLEPLADDIASLGLDMLVSEAGYHRAAPNPFVVTG
jgi:FdhE protein